MKLQQLEVLVAVAENGGIRAASRHLNLSQAAVTKAMRLLEQEAGVPLLIRKARGITLTEPGQRLLARARVVSRQVSLAREDLRQSQGEDFGSVRVGVTPFLTFTALGPAFNWFRQLRISANVSGDFGNVTGWRSDAGLRGEDCRDGVVLPGLYAS